MASLSPSFSLLHGPTARLLHRSSHSESFHILNDNAPLRMLNHFSSAIRSRLPRSLQCICHGYGPVPACLLHGLAFQRPQARSATVQIAGGDYSAHIDLIKWMEQCCRYQAIVPLSTVMTALAQQARALTCIDILRIDVLQQELPNLISCIQVNSIGPREVRELFRSRRDVPAIILDTVCQSIATRFATGILSFCALDNWYEVADRHRRFDSGVKHCLRALESQDRYSGNYERLENTRRVWTERSVNRYERHLTRRSFERERRRSHRVPDLFVGQHDRYYGAVGDVFIEAYQPPPSVYSWPRQPFQPAWIPQHQPTTPPHPYPPARNLFEPLRPQYSYHDPQPPWPSVSPNGVTPPMPFQTPQMHHTVHHFHHSPRNRTPPQRPSYSNSRYHYQHGPSYRRHSQDHHRWHRMRWSGGVRSVDD